MSFPRYEKYKDSGVDKLGEVPNHWRSMPLKAIASCNDDSLSEDTDPGYEILYVDISSVEATKGIAAKELLLFSAAPSRARRKVQDGDVIVSTVRTYLRAIAKIRQPEENLVVSTGFAVIRPSNKIRHDFLGHAIAASFFVDEVISRSVGVSYPAINSSDLMRIPIPLPPLEEQEAIAEFLDRETSKIDALVAEQRRLIDLLKEKRQAIISHAVTKGLNPNASMRDSGVEWLGRVPSHWSVISLAKVTLSRCDGPFGSGLKSEHYTESGVRVVRLQNIRAGHFDNRDAAFVDADYCAKELSGHDVEGGDVLIAGLGDDNNIVGRACVAPSEIVPAMVKADCFRFRLDPTRARPAFVVYQLCAGASTDAGALATGSTRSRIPLSDMASRRLALPPSEEQEAIVALLDEETRKIDSLVLEAERAIELLQERRTALISAAVTGKIDVRPSTGSGLKQLDE